MRHQTVVVQTDSGPALVFDIAKKRYVYHGGQDTPVLNLEHTENAQSAWIRLCRQRHWRDARRVRQTLRSSTREHYSGTRCLRRSPH